MPCDLQTVEFAVLVGAFPLLLPVLVPSGRQTVLLAVLVGDVLLPLPVLMS